MDKVFCFLAFIKRSRKEGPGFGVLALEPGGRELFKSFVSGPLSLGRTAILIIPFKQTSAEGAPKIILGNFFQIIAAFLRSSPPPTPQIKPTFLIQLKTDIFLRSYFSKKGTRKPNVENSLNGIYIWRRLLFVL